MLKTCNICNLDKTIDNYFKNRNGFLSRCRDCTNLKRRERRSKLSREEKDKQNNITRQYYSKNLKKVRQKQKNYYNLNKEKIWKHSRKYMLKRKYNLSQYQYESMLISQNNKCAICNKEEIVKHKSGKIKSLAVDHCHKTGKIRGLLCAWCNRGIGLFNDDVDCLIKAIGYLKK